MTQILWLKNSLKEFFWRKKCLQPSCPPTDICKAEDSPPKEERHLTHRLNTWGSTLPSFIGFWALHGSAEAATTHPGLPSLTCNGEDITGEASNSVPSPAWKVGGTQQKVPCLLHSCFVPSGFGGEPCASPAPQSNSEYYKTWAEEPLAQDRRDTGHDKNEHFSWSLPFLSRVRPAYTGSLLPPKFSEKSRSTLPWLTHKLRAILSLMSNKATS